MKFSTIANFLAASTLAAAHTRYETVIVTTTVVEMVTVRAGETISPSSDTAENTYTPDTPKQSKKVDQSDAASSQAVTSLVSLAQMSSSRFSTQAKVLSSAITSATSSVVTSESATQSKSQSSSSSSVDVYAEISQCQGLNESFARNMLDYHNTVRRIHQVPEMSWNKTLWEYAQTHADAYVCGSGLKHTGGPWGENLFAGLSNPTTAARGWYDEEKDWKYGVNGTQYSHFSQMVWKDTRQIGCAYHLCTDKTKSYPGYYVICNYFVFGNRLHTQAKQVFPPIKSLQYLTEKSSTQASSTQTSSA